MTAVSYDKSGNICYQNTRVTAGDPYKIDLEVEYGQEITNNKADVSLVRAKIVDKNGFVVPSGSNNITFTTSGVENNIAGVGNGDPSCHQPDKANYRLAWNGLALCIVRGGWVEGQITVTAKSEGL